MIAQQAGFTWPIPDPWAAATECAIELERSTWNWLLAVVIGSGGKAGGRFLLNSVSGLNNPFSRHYCDRDYISGQGGYILGD